MLTALKCPNCAAPLPPSAETVTVCPYCAHTITGVPAVPWGSRLLREPWAGRAEDSGKQRVVVAGRPYVVLGRLGQGDGCDVFLGRLDARLTEMVALKVLRVADDADLLNREWEMLGRLSSSSARGADFFAGLLPQRVTHGRLVTAGRRDTRANVFRFRSGFHHTLSQVIRAYPKGIDPRAGVWMWKRALEMLGWVHASGYAHAAVIPDHLLLHPRDHGVTLVGWSAATRLGRPLVAGSSRARELYPDAVWRGAPPSPASDLTMLARSLLKALPPSLPSPLAGLLRRCADPTAAGRVDDAWALLEQVTDASRAAFGPPTYVPFHMPPRS